MSGIPTLIFLDGETGKAINKNGRSVVDANPDGQGFPWKAKTLHDILKQGEYMNNKDEKKSFEEDIKDKVLGIYFSAHWVSSASPILLTRTICLKGVLTISILLINLQMTSN